MQKNMLVPGHVEKWVKIANANKFKISEMPVDMFKMATKEISGNIINYSAKQMIVNIAWWQAFVLKTF